MATEGRRRGKAVLFSSEPSGAGRTGPGGGGGGGSRRRWVVSCRSCRAETPVTGTELVRRLFRPGVLWWPLSRHPHRMTCPACGDTTWCQVRQRRA